MLKYSMRYFLIFTFLALVSLINFDIYAPLDNYQRNNQSPKDQTKAQTKNVEGDKLSTQETYLVTRVIDGDTIIVLIDGKEKTVRYIGIDTPETVRPLKPVECFGQEASIRNKELVLGRMVRLIKDVSETDQYGRLLRYVYFNDEFINLSLVQGGFANVYSYPPDIEYNELFKQAEQEARATKTGLWGNKCQDK